MIPQSVIDDDNEHTMHYSQSLPYANLLDKEAEIWLSDICTHLVISVRAKDFTGGALAWVRRLSRYLSKI
jgi:proteasome activator subunit 4